MPKLSQQTLDKMFSCPHCGEKIRTRQGLSGHIQFKHKLGTLKEEPPYVNEVLQAKELKLRAIMLQSSKEEISELSEILSFWYHLKAIVQDDNIKLNNTDYKTYMIVAMAQMKANRLLYQKLQKEQDATIPELLKIKSETTPKFYEKELREYPCQ